MGIQESMKKFVECIVKELVDRQDDVEINTFVSTKAIVIQIKTAKEKEICLAVLSQQVCCRQLQKLLP